MIEPLLEKEIIIKTRDTKGMYNGSDNNFVFDLNLSKLDLNKSKVHRLMIK